MMRLAIQLVRFPLVTLCVALFMLAPDLSADVIVLKDGRRFEGVIKSESESEVVFETRFGTMKFDRKNVSSLERGTTPAQELDVRYKECKTADDFFRLGKWAEKSKLRGSARKAMRRARKLQPQHAGACEWLGLVLYEGVWMEPKERDARRANKEAAEMRKRGLVRHGEEWVTLAEKDRLDAGLIYFNGRWLTEEQLHAAKGEVRLDGNWVNAGFAEGINHSRALLETLDWQATEVYDSSSIVVGDFDESFLEGILDGLSKGRAWAQTVLPKLPLPGVGQEPVAQFFVLGRTAAVYPEMVDQLDQLTDTTPEGWAEIVKQTHGFVFWHPRGVSAARCLGRPDEHLHGHSFHHLGHILCNRFAYDGRLLPPWLDEGFASLLEYRVHGANQVFCLGRFVASSESGGTSASKREYTFDSKVFRRGGWEQSLRRALESGDRRIKTFDVVARKQFGELQLVDIACGMAILSWLESRGEGALERFLAAVKKSAPKAPLRVVLKGVDRQSRYDQAFTSAVGMTWSEADAAWRAWFIEGGR